MVVQLLVFYYVSSSDHRMEHNGSSGRDACVRIEQRRIYFGNYAKRNEIGRRRTDGSGTCSRIKFRGEYDEDCHSAGCKEFSSDSRKRIYRAYQRNIGCKFRRRGGYMYVAFNYIGTNSYEFMVPYIVMALIYIALILVVTLLVKLLERSLKKSDRRN